MEILEKKQSSDGSIKYLWSLDDGRTVESVYFAFRGAIYTCISSQVGCNVACPFCETGKQIALRDLTDDEIVEQVQRTLNELGDDGATARLDHVAVAGMGEPLLNFKNIASAAERVRNGGLATT